MSSETTFDLIVIGSGPGGYVASIRAAQLGFKTACVEKEKALGGTCVRVGCIPSKAMLASSEHFHAVKHKFAKHGIKVSGLELDLATMLKRKDEVVKSNTSGVEFLFKKNKIEWLKGHGKIKGKDGSDYLVEVDGKVVKTKRVLLATGSSVTELPFLKFDGQNIVSSTEALSFTEVPKHLIVIGGGVIGLELGSVWARLGAKVTVVEYTDKLLALMDPDCVKELQKSLTKLGIEFKLGAKALGAKVEKGSITVEAEDRATGKAFTLTGDKVLVSTGRKPYTDGLGLDSIGITTDKAGRIEIDDQFRTKAEGVYAIGDVVRGMMLAHKAEEEGIAAVEIMAKKSGHVNYNAIPNVIYTWPEMASVGFTEAELKEKGIATKSGTFPFMANGRARASDEIEGVVKIIADAKTDKVLGAHICGPSAGELIAEIVSVIEFGGSAEDIARTCHAHPTLSEAVKEAALDVDKRRINL